MKVSYFGASNNIIHGSLWGTQRGSLECLQCCRFFLFLFFPCFVLPQLLSFIYFNIAPIHLGHCLFPRVCDMKRLTRGHTFGAHNKYFQKHKGD